MAAVVIRAVVAGAAHGDVGLTPGEVYRFSTTDHVVAQNEALALSTLRIPFAVLERVAADRFDVSARKGTAADGHSGVGVLFDGHEPLDDGLRRGWLHMTAFARSQLDPASPGGSSPLVLAALGELVAAAALATFPNPTMASTATAGPEWAAPAVVRRAVAHIEDHADQPLAVSDIARAAGVGPRALQLAFARHVGTSPTAMLRRVRLQRAHRELQSADPTAGDTAEAVAHRWGWASASRFSAAYQRLHRVRPSQTLRA